MRNCANGLLASLRKCSICAVAQTDQQTLINKLAVVWGSVSLRAGCFFFSVKDQGPPLHLNDQSRAQTQSRKARFFCRLSVRLVVKDQGVTSRHIWSAPPFRLTCLLASYRPASACHLQQMGDGCHFNGVSDRLLRGAVTLVPFPPLRRNRCLALAIVSSEGFRLSLLPEFF